MKGNVTSGFQHDIATTSITEWFFQYFGILHNPEFVYSINYSRYGKTNNEPSDHKEWR
jgi:hypothetical protein